jgi:hypothetical protein
LKAVVESLATQTVDLVLCREKDIYHALPEANSVFKTAAARALVGSYGASIILNERERYEKAIIKARGSRDEAAKLLRCRAQPFSSCKGSWSREITRPRRNSGAFMMRMPRGFIASSTIVLATFIGCVTGGKVSEQKVAVAQSFNDQHLNYQKSKSRKRMLCRAEIKSQ